MISDVLSTRKDGFQNNVKVFRFSNMYAFGIFCEADWNRNTCKKVSEIVLKSVHMTFVLAIVCVFLLGPIHPVI